MTLKRGMAEWFNEDCPPIEDADGNRIFSSFINGTYAEEKYRFELYRFITASYSLACKKYGWEQKTLSWLEQSVRPEYLGFSKRGFYRHNPQTGFNELVSKRTGEFTGKSPY